MNMHLPGPGLHLNLYRPLLPEVGPNLHGSQVIPDRLIISLVDLNEKQNEDLAKLSLPQPISSKDLASETIPCEEICKKKLRAISSRRHNPFERQNNKVRYHFKLIQEISAAASDCLNVDLETFSETSELPKTKVNTLIEKMQEFKQLISKVQEENAILLSSQEKYLQAADPIQEEEISVLGKRPRTEEDFSKCYINRFLGGKKIRFSSIEEADEFAKKNYFIHLSKCFYQDKEEKGDVCLIVDGKRFKAHKEILIRSSLYFEAMFHGYFNESQHLNEISLENTPNLTADLFGKLLVYFYGGKVEISNFSQAIDFLVCADYFFNENLKADCLDYINKNLSISTALELFELSVQASCMTGKHWLLPFICFNGIPCLLEARPEQLGRLSAASLALILIQNELSLEESQVIEVICHWMKIKIENEKLSPEQISALLDFLRPFVRLPLCSYDDLYDKWQNLRIGDVLFFDKNHFDEAVDESIRETTTPRRKLDQYVEESFDKNFQFMNIKPNGYYPINLLFRPNYLNGNLRVERDEEGNLWFVCLSDEKESQINKNESFVIGIAYPFSHSCHRVLTPITFNRNQVYTRLLLHCDDFSLLKDQDLKIGLTIFPITINDEEIIKI